MPVIFKSFGDYKPGLYVYLTIPFVAIFGLNEFAVRLPSAIAGVIAVWLVYKIILFLAKQKNEKRETKHESLAIIAALLLAISPWHIHFSRGAWEVNVALTLTLVGIYFFLKSIIHNSKFIIHSSLFLSLTFLTYQGAKLSSIIVVFSLLLVYWKEFKGIGLKRIILSIVTAFIVSIPIIFLRFDFASLRS